MKQDQLQRCGCCGEGMGAAAVDFFVVNVERYIIDVGAVRRQHGLEMAMGDSAPLAAIMGPDEDMAQMVGEPTKQFICAQCAYMSGTHLADVLMPASDDDLIESIASDSH